jgi:hypothetical protein
MPILIGFYMLFILVYGAISFFSGYYGLYHDFGVWWATAGLICAIPFRFTLPLTIGAFLCALHVWHWHWFWAATFASPGLILVIPGMIQSMLVSLRRN